jgi:hypothetical protein
MGPALRKEAVIRLPDRRRQPAGRHTTTTTIEQTKKHSVAFATVHRPISSTCTNTRALSHGIRSLPSPFPREYHIRLHAQLLWNRRCLRRSSYRITEIDAEHGRSITVQLETYRPCHIPPFLPTLVHTAGHILRMVL